MKTIPLCKLYLGLNNSPRNNKIRIYKTLIKPVLCYGSIDWTLTQMTEQILCTFEGKISRIYRSIQDKDAGVLDGIVKFVFYTKL
jgi:hypothetical protein